MKSRLFTFLLVSALAILLVLREESRQGGATLNEIHLGWLRANSHVEEAKNPSILLVELNDGDAPKAERIFQSWPLSVLDYALLFENLLAHNPRNLAVEPLLVWPPESSPFLQSLASRLDKAQSLLLATQGEYSEFGLQDSHGYSDPNKLCNRHLEIKNTSGDLRKIPEITSFIGAPSKDLHGEAVLAFTGIDLGAGIEHRDNGVISIPLVGRVGTRVIASFPLAALLRHRGIDINTVRMDSGNAILAPGLNIPIDSHGRFSLGPDAFREIPQINARVFALSLPTTESSETEADGENASGKQAIGGLIESDDDYRKLHLMKSHLVVLGRTDQGTPHHSGPDGAPLSQAEIFCQAIAAMDIGQDGLHSIEWLDLAVTAGVLLLCCLSLRFPRPCALKFQLILAISLTAVSLIAFQQWHFWVPVLRALLLVACAATVALLVPLSSKESEGNFAS